MTDELSTNENKNEKKAAPAILYCDCVYGDVVPESSKRELLKGLDASGAELVYVPDLCQAAARRDKTLGKYAALKNLKIIACQARAVRWLFESAGVSLSEDVEFLSLRNQTAEEILNRVSGEDPKAEEGTVVPAEKKKDWVPWFPVIDYSKCTSCQQCLSFCLFGVFEVSDDGGVVVENPRNCKNNCPACARICPEVAIMFPKLPEAPLDGAELDEEEMAGANVKVDIERFLGDDAYEALADRRSKARRRLLKKKAVEPSFDAKRAYEERSACACNCLPAQLAAEGGEAPCNCECTADGTSNDAEADACDCDCDCGPGGEEEKNGMALTASVEQRPCGCDPGEVCDEEAPQAATVEEANSRQCADDSEQGR